jgi:two-component system alkaline phosphatase synthesis response regulator PhoP
MNICYTVSENNESEIEPMTKVLIVDDELAIVTLLQYNLEQAGYDVDAAGDGRTGLTMATTGGYDIILLDLMLPELDGMEVLRSLRQEKIDTPVLLVTAKGDEFDRVLGLELGADDYITKPFSPREVLARIKAVGRRYNIVTEAAAVEHETPVDEVTLQFDDLYITPERKQVRKGNKTLALTPREYDLLLYFAQRQGRVLDRETILSQVMGFEYTGESRMVDMHISNLREKIEQDPKHPLLLKTVRGFGYMFGGE